MTGRRTVLAALVLAPIALRAGSAWAGGTGRRRFAPLPGRYRLARRVTRQLGEHDRLVIERAWSIAFVPQGRGFLVEGRPAGLVVDTPPELAFLARIERERPETGVFPLSLDERGLMIGPAGAPAGGDLAAALDAVRGRLAQQLAQAERSAAERFLDHLQRAGEEALTRWPRDLFAPERDAVAEAREVPLPDGRTGALALALAATRDPATGLMQRLERRLETRTGQGVRSGSELFTLTRET